MKKKSHHQPKRKPRPSKAKKKRKPTPPSKPKYADIPRYLGKRAARQRWNHKRMSESEVQAEAQYDPSRDSLYKDDQEDFRISALTRRAYARRVYDQHQKQKPRGVRMHRGRLRKPRPPPVPASRTPAAFWAAAQSRNDRYRTLPSSYKRRRTVSPPALVDLKALLRRHLPPP
jgi:hypothetical protein